LSEEKELSDGTRTAVFYTKLKAEFSPDIDFFDNKNVTEVNNAFVSASNGTIAYATRKYGEYVGHYVDNIKMKIEIPEIKENNVHTYLDLREESVLNKYYTEIGLGSETVIERTEEGLYVANVTDISANLKNFMQFVFPEKITVTPGNDYYMAIKYKYDDGGKYSFFTNGSSILSDAEANGEYNSAVSRHFQALAQSVNHYNVIRLADGWNV
jgi:hypothetical protein